MLRGSGVWVLGFENRRLARLESSPKKALRIVPIAPIAEIRGL